MPAGDDIYQTIGFVLEAKDLASAIATKAQKILDAAASDMENTLLGMTTTIEKVSDAGGKAAKAAAENIKTIGGKLVDLSGLTKEQADARVEVARAAAEEQANLTREAKAELSRAFAEAAKAMDASLGEKAVAPMVTSLEDVARVAKHLATEAIGGPFRLLGDRVLLPVAMKIANVGEAAQTAFNTLMSLPGKAIDAVGALGDKLQETVNNLQNLKFEDVFDGAMDGAKKLAGAIKGGLGKTLDVVGGTVKKGLVGGFQALKTGAVFAGGAVNKVFQTGLSLFKLGGKGGLMGALLGPLGPILTLLEPIISALTRAFAPAMETLSALLDAVFAPFAGILDTIMQSMMPLIQKALGPLVALLELAAVQVGFFLQGLMDSSGAGAGFFAVIGKLMPVVSKVFSALGDLAKRIFPIIIKLVQMLAPIAIRIIEYVGDAVAKILPILATVIERSFPQLIDAVGKLLEAVLPLLPPLLRLGVVLLEKVFAPLLIHTITLVAEGLTVVATVLAEDVLPIATEVLDYVTAAVTDFFDHFEKYVTDFYILFIQPIVDTVAEGGRAIYEALGLERVGRAVRGAFDGILAAVSSPIETLKGFLNEHVIATANAILGWAVPVVGTTLSQALGWGDWRVPQLAEGGIATGDTLANVGEAGPEMILPLRPDTVRTALQPVLADLSLPGLDEAVRGLDRIERVLRGTLRVALAEGMGGGGEARAGAPSGQAAADARDLESAVGAGGLAMGWEG